jgi:hypothetical protein
LGGSEPRERPRGFVKARHAIYEQARTALHEGLGNDPQISDAELVNEHHRLEVAVYEVEEDLLLNNMRRFVRENTHQFTSVISLTEPRGIGAAY